MAKSSAKISVGFLFDDTLDSSDAVAQYLKTLGAWLSSQGYTVSYLVGQTKLEDWSGGHVYSLARNQTVYFNGNRLTMPVKPDKKLIRQVLRDNHFDVLHVMVPYSPLMAQSVINFAKPETAIVGTFHIFPSGWLSSFGSRLLRLMYGRSLGRFSEIVSVSPAAARFAHSAYGLETRVIPNPVDISRFQVKQGPKNGDELRVVFLGRLVKRKGCRQLIEAFRLLTKDLPNVRLVIAGDGGQRQSLAKLVKSYGLDGQVEFLGYVEEGNKPELLASADVACFPSLYGESFGIVLIEAMAAGAKTVLGGDNPGYRSVLGAKPLLLVDPNDAPALAGRLKELLTDHKLRGEIYEWQQSAVKQYDIAVVGAQIMDLYDSAIARLNKNDHNKAYE